MTNTLLKQILGSDDELKSEQVKHKLDHERLDTDIVRATFWKTKKMHKMLQD